jgi:hypothetical protein
VNEGWRWTTVLTLSLALGCLLVAVLVVVVLGATFLSIAWTLTRPRPVGPS